MDGNCGNGSVWAVADGVSGQASVGGQTLTSLADSVRSNLGISGTAVQSLECQVGWPRPVTHHPHRRMGALIGPTSLNELGNGLTCDSSQQGAVEMGQVLALGGGDVAPLNYPGEMPGMPHLPPLLSRQLPLGVHSSLSFLVQQSVGAPTAESGLPTGVPTKYPTVQSVGAPTGEPCDGAAGTATTVAVADGAAAIATANSYAAGLAAAAVAHAATATALTAARSAEVCSQWARAAATRRRRARERHRLWVLTSVQTRRLFAPGSGGHKPRAECLSTAAREVLRRLNSPVSRPRKRQRRRRAHARAAAWRRYTAGDWRACQEADTRTCIGAARAEVEARAMRAAPSAMRGATAAAPGTALAATAAITVVTCAVMGAAMGGLIGGLVGALLGVLACGASLAVATVGQQTVERVAAAMTGQLHARMPSHSPTTGPTGGRSRWKRRRRPRQSAERLHLPGASGVLHTHRPSRARRSPD